MRNGSQVLVLRSRKRKSSPAARKGEPDGKEKEKSEDGRRDTGSLCLRKNFPCRIMKMALSPRREGRNRGATPKQKRIPFRRSLALGEQN